MSHFFFEKDNCLVSISNAILKHFTGNSFHTPHPKMMEILGKNKYDKIVLMLFDGMGKSIQEKYLSPKDFLMRKKAFDGVSCCSWNSQKPLSSLSMIVQCEDKAGITSAPLPLRSVSCTPDASFPHGCQPERH